MRISIVTPLYCSAPYIEGLYQRCVATLARMTIDDYEIIFVHDASPQDDLAIAKRIARQDDRVRVIDLARNYGQHRALMVGLEHATGDLVFVLDSDLEEAPEWLERFRVEMREKRCDVVYGVQTQPKRSACYRIGRSTFYRALRLLSGVNVPEGAVTARLMSRRYVRAVLDFHEREIDIASIWAMAGFSQVPVQVEKLDTSPTTYSVQRILALVINAVTSVSTRPLIMGGVVAIFVCLIALGYTAAVVIDKLVFGVPVEGWASLMSAMLILGGLNLLLTGTVAVYVAKIFLEAKQRPAALIREIHGRIPQRPGYRRPDPRSVLFSARAGAVRRRVTVGPQPPGDTMSPPPAE